MRPGGSEQEPAVWSEREATSSKVSSAPGRKAPVGWRTGPVSSGVRSRVSRTERQARRPGTSIHPRQGAAVAESRHALYRGGVQHSPNALRPSVSGAAGRAVATVRVGTTCASVGDGRRGRRGHDRRRQATRDGSGADRGAICDAPVRARGVVGGAGRRRVGRCLAAAVRPGSVVMRRRHGFASQWHFSPAPESGSDLGPARGGASSRCGRRDHDEARSTGDADVWGRAVGSGPAVADSGRSFPTRAGPLAVAARRGRSRKLRDVGPMRRATGRRVSWVGLQARMGRRPAIGAGGTARGGDIGTLSGSWTVGAPDCAERLSKSVSCAELGRCGARSRGTVLLAIATVIASNLAPRELCPQGPEVSPSDCSHTLFLTRCDPFGRLCAPAAYCFCLKRSWATIGPSQTHPSCAPVGRHVGVGPWRAAEVAVDDGAG